MRVCANAENGYATIGQFAPGIKNPEYRNEITQGLAELRVVLDVLQQRLHT
jgi:hypothetical protein